jgi:hypothetical protein
VAVLAAKKNGDMVVEVTALDTDIKYSGMVQTEVDEGPDLELPDDAPTHQDDVLEGVYTGSYFNIDIQQYLPIQLTAGHYQVVIVYAGSRSNSVSFEILSH